MDRRTGAQRPGLRFSRRRPPSPPLGPTGPSFRGFRRRRRGPTGPSFRGWFGIRRRGPTGPRGWIRIRRRRAGLAGPSFRLGWRLRGRLTLGNLLGRLPLGCWRWGWHWCWFWYWCWGWWYWGWGWWCFRFIQTTLGSTGLSFWESLHLFMAIFLFIRPSDHQFEGHGMPTEVHYFIRLVPNLER